MNQIMYVCVWVGVFDNSEYVRLNEFHVSLVTVCADILVVQRLISSQELSRHDRPPEGGCIVVVFFFFIFYVQVVSKKSYIFVGNIMKKI